MKQIDYVGRRVRIGGPHPWSGETGTIKDYKRRGVLSKKAFLVELDNGIDCYVPEKQLKVVDRHGNNNTNLGCNRREMG